MTSVRKTSNKHGLGSKSSKFIKNLSSLCLFSPRIMNHIEMHVCMFQLCICLCVKCCSVLQGHAHIYEGLVLFSFTQSNDLLHACSRNTQHVSERIVKLDAQQDNLPLSSRIRVPIQTFLIMHPSLLEMEKNGSARCFVFQKMLIKW